MVLVIESAAAYSLLLLLDGIGAVAPTDLQLHSPAIKVIPCVETALTIMTITTVSSSNHPADNQVSLTYNQGMAPTVVVERIIIIKPNNTAASTTAHISSLQILSPSKGLVVGQIPNGDVNALKSYRRRHADPGGWSEKGVLCRWHFEGLSSLKYVDCGYIYPRVSPLSPY